MNGVLKILYKSNSKSILVFISFSCSLFNFFWTFQTFENLCEVFLENFFADNGNFWFWNTSLFDGVSQGWENDSLSSVCLHF